MIAAWWIAVALTQAVLVAAWIIRNRLPRPLFGLLAFANAAMGARLLYAHHLLGLLGFVAAAVAEALALTQED